MFIGVKSSRQLECRSNPNQPFYQLSVNTQIFNVFTNEYNEYILRLIILLEQLKFSPPPVNKRLELNASAKIHCKVQGTPTPKVAWHKVYMFYYLFIYIKAFNTNFSNAFQAYNESLPNDVQSINGTIQFSKVTKIHKGNYTCIASNSQGTIDTTIHIDVVGKYPLFPLLQL